MLAHLTVSAWPLQVASFTEEYLAIMASEIREFGTDFIPMVHFLPGRAHGYCGCSVATVC